MSKPSELVMAEYGFLETRAKAVRDGMHHIGHQLKQGAYSGAQLEATYDAIDKADAQREFDDLMRHHEYKPMPYELPGRILQQDLQDGFLKSGYQYSWANKRKNHPLGRGYNKDHGLPQIQAEQMARTRYPVSRGGA